MTTGKTQYQTKVENLLGGLQEQMVEERTRTDREEREGTHPTASDRGKPSGWGTQSSEACETITRKATLQFICFIHSVLGEKRVRKRLKNHDKERSS